jgi:hypothetical protein
MADYRRARGALRDPVNLGWEVERVKRERFKAMAENCELSAAVFFEQVVEHLEQELTNQGIPSWMPEKDRTGELPIEPA